MKMRIFIVTSLIVLFLLLHLVVGMPRWDSLIPVAFVASCILLIRELDQEDDKT